MFPSEQNRTRLSRHDGQQDSPITKVTSPFAATYDLIPGIRPQRSVTSVLKEKANNVTGASYNYSYDSMYRLSGMTTSGSTTVVSGVSYNAANQLLGMTFNGVAETRGYNVLNQLTNVHDGSAVNLTYNYPTGTNNGKVSSMYNAVSGETVTYTYDSLNRIATAGGSGWGEAYTFDPLRQSHDQDRHQRFGAEHVDLRQRTHQSDLGQLTMPTATASLPTPCLRCRESHLRARDGTTARPHQLRLRRAEQTRFPVSSARRTATAIRAAIRWSRTRRAARSWGCIRSSPATIPLAIKLLCTICDSLTTSDQYFGGRRLASMDQFGSVGTYYPWGEAKGTTNPQDTWSYATYWRDSVSALDYANNRYYSNAYGRFMTPDPYQA